MSTSGSISTMMNSGSTTVRFQLIVRAQSLRRSKAFFSKPPNTFAVLSNCSDVGSVLGVKRHRLQATEVVPLSSSPEWATITIIPHQMGTDHRVAVDIFHTNSMEKKHHQEEVGEHHINFRGKGVHYGTPVPADSEQLCGMLVDIGAVLKTPNMTLKLDIPGTADGRLIVKLEACRPNCDDFTFFQFHLRGFSFLNPRRTLIDRAEFFFEIHRKHFNDWILVYRSDVEKGGLSPFWKAESMSLTTFANHDLSRDLRIRVLDLDSKKGDRKLLGEFFTTPHGLLGAVTNNGNCDTSRAFPLIRSDTKKKVGQMVVVVAKVVTSGEAVGAIIAQPMSELEIMTPPVTPTADCAISVLTTPTAFRVTSNFEDIMARGSLELCVAIDFTTTNGDPTQPSTPHYRSPNTLNDYQWIMSVVEETARDFSVTEEYPIWGFGGNHNGQEQPIFLCGHAPKVKGITGMLSAYQDTFGTEIKFGSRRSFDTVIAAAAQHARKSLSTAEQQDHFSYTVLLVLTVGEDKDILAAKDKIVAASKAPISILFVRVPTPGRQLSFDPLKLEVYLGNRGCRDFCMCVDAKDLAKNRDQRKLSEVMLKGLRDHVPKYFSS